MNPVGFIGLGAMGGHIAQHLLRHGHDLCVFARRAEAVRAVVASGASVAASPREVAETCDVVFTMVTTTADVDHVLFGDDGVAAAARAGLLVIDMTTIAPAAAALFAQRLSALGADLIDAPVSGGPEGARDGTLTIMAGGTPEALARAVPLFECFSSTILHVGPSGSGQATKACHQLLLLITAEGVAEALTLAKRSGLDPSLVRSAMMSGMASSRVLERFGLRMAAREFSAGIPVRLYRKDLQIVLDHAQSLGLAIPAGAATLQHLKMLIDSGGDGLDLSAIVTVLETAGASDDQPLP